VQAIRKPSRTVIKNLALPLARGTDGPETQDRTCDTHGARPLGLRHSYNEPTPHALARSYLQTGEGGLFRHFTHHKLVLPVPSRATGLLVHRSQAVGSSTNIQGAR
jgi:hypothetical protein